MGVDNEKFLICEDGRVIRETKIPRPYNLVHEYQADGSMVLIEYGKPKACDND